MLALDIGNTTIKAAAFERGKIVWSASAPDADSLHAELAKLKNPKAAAACSVSPSQDAPVAAIVREAFGLPTAFLGKDLPACVPIVCCESEKVGADRLANAMAAYHRAGGAAIVADCGTAITFDVISDKGEFIGGVIAPGIGTSLAALHEKTALLPLVAVVEPAGAVGKNTVEAILAGVVGGIPGLVDRVVENIRAELSYDFTIYATGGHSRWIAPRCRTVTEVVPTLTLEGVYLAWKRNQRRRREGTENAQMKDNETTR